MYARKAKPNTKNKYAHLERSDEGVVGYIRKRVKKNKKAGRDAFLLLGVSLCARPLVQQSERARAGKDGDSADDGEQGQLLEDVE